MATDPYSSHSATPGSFGRKSRIITPGATDLDPIAKSVVMLATGDITVVPVSNSDATTIAFVGVPAGWVCPFQVRRVTAASVSVATIED